MRDVCPSVREIYQTNIEGEENELRELLLRIAGGCEIQSKSLVKVFLFRNPGFEVVTYRPGEMGYQTPEGYPQRKEAQRALDALITASRVYYKGEKRGRRYWVAA